MATDETLKIEFLNNRRGNIGSLDLFSIYMNAATITPVKMNRAARSDGGMAGFLMKVKARNMELKAEVNVIIPP